MINKTKKYDAVFCADIHLRQDTPIARTDDYFQAQENKIKTILAIQNVHKCPLIIAGDLFDKARVSENFMAQVIQYFENIKYPVHIIPGNHDLPQHNLKLLDDSSLNVLCSANSYIHVHKVELDDIYIFSFQKRKIGIVHTLLHKSEPIMQDGRTVSGSAKTFLRKHKEFDVILVGDNHKTFEIVLNNRILVSPGSMMRMKANQDKHKPCIFLYDAEQNNITPHYFEIQKDVITREHIEVKEQYDMRMDTLLESLDTNIELGLNYKKNLENIIIQNKIKKPVQNEIWESVEK